MNSLRCSCSLSLIRSRVSSEAPRQHAVTNAARNIKTSATKAQLSMLLRAKSRTQTHSTSPASLACNRNFTDLMSHTHNHRLHQQQPARQFTEQAKQQHKQQQNDKLSLDELTRSHNPLSHNQATKSRPCPNTPFNKPLPLLQCNTPTRSVPEHILHPPYALSSLLNPRSSSHSRTEIEIKTPLQIGAMRIAGQLADHIRNYAGSLCVPGRTTDEIDALVHAEVIRHHAYPSPLLYSGFPKSCCTSVNQVVCHGIPDSRPLEVGDIVNVDVSVYTSDRVHGDCSDTFFVGGPEACDEKARHLVQTTHAALAAAIKICGPGVPINAIGNVIHDMADAAGLSVVESFCGHGIGHEFHMAPFVFHVRNAAPTRGILMREGMIFTIEPMLNEGSKLVELLDDDWTIVTKDGQRSAQVEQEILITSNGYDILTARHSNPQLTSRR